MDLKGAQFYDRIKADTSYPLHQNIKNTPSTYYTSILDTIPTARNGTSNSTHMHNTLATNTFHQQTKSKQRLGDKPSSAERTEFTYPG